jgi:hypothetical protein
MADLRKIQVRQASVASNKKHRWISHGKIPHQRLPLEFSDGLLFIGCLLNLGDQLLFGRSRGVRDKKCGGRICDYEALFHGQIPE